VAKQEQIVKLQNEMSALQGEIGALNAEAQQIQSKIESTARNFKVSLEILKGQINLDKQNITTFIQQ
jgi:peptidoglycan hydrolase CwlO-like protein